jgi:L-ascorbate metabolism protein UlaG (beta-lactamase superfamily)
VIEPWLSDNALLRDVAHHERHVGLNRFHLWWLGQSGYLLSWEQQRVLIDPYLSDSLTAKYAGTKKPHVRMSRRVISPQDLPRVGLVTSSHNHTDHLDAETLTPVLERSPQARVLVPEANRAFAADRLKVPPERLTGVDAGGCMRATDMEVFAVPAAHPVTEQDDRGRHRYLGYIFRFGGWSIYHSGDTLAYGELVERLTQFPIDVAILPINGKVGNMGGRDAARLAKDVGARLVIPCHYDLFAFNTADPNDEFVPECERLGQPYRVLKLGERFTSSEIPRP